jgi:hypothetical protein
VTNTFAGTYEYVYVDAQHVVPTDAQRRQAFADALLGNSAIADMLADDSIGDDYGE